MFVQELCNVIDVAVDRHPAIFIAGMGFNLEKKKRKKSDTIKLVESNNGSHTKNKRQWKDSKTGVYMLKAVGYCMAVC